MDLEEALNNQLWKKHKLGDTYSMLNRDGSESGTWKIAYYPLFGTYKGEGEDKNWIDFKEPRALIEQPIEDGIDFREVPLRYLNKI